MAEQPPADRVLRFKATPGFRGWTRFFTKASVRHPAKMNMKLLQFLLEMYTKEGDTVVDPLAGTGSSIVLASLLGRNGVAVELEPKFCDMIRGNIEKTTKEVWFRPKGRMAYIQGDSRELSKLLAESEAIISSPPYGNRLADVAVNDGDPQRMGYRQAVSIVTSPPYEGSLSGDKDGPGATSINNPSGFKASSDPGYTLETTWTERNKPEAIVSSPPFGPSQKGGGIYKKGYIGVRRGKVYLDPRLPERQGHPLSDNPDNIDNMPYGNIESVITSPPYEKSSLGVHDSQEARADRLRKAGHEPAKFLGGQARNATLPERYDGIVSSPPYESGLRDRGQSFEEVRAKLLARGFSEEYIKASWSQPNQCQRWAEEGYGHGKRNVGNLRGESYLSEMQKIYAECFSVLKPGGVMVLVVRNFVRNFKLIRLDLDTIRICEAAGFSLKERWWFKLPGHSFWRINYKRKYPDAPSVDFEDVLVFQKA